MFKGKTEKQVHNIIKEVGNYYRDDLSSLGYEYGVAYNSAGFKITERTPLWSEILEMDFINSFEKGYYLKNVIDIVSVGITDNIPECIGVSIDYPLNYHSFDGVRNKFIKVLFGILMKDDSIIIVSIESIDRKMMFGLIGPTYFDDLINYPLTEINKHLANKRELLDDLFVQYDSKGFYINEEF